MISMLQQQPWRPRGAKPIAKLFQDKGVYKFCELLKCRVGLPLCLGNHRGIARD